jgi:hypothetical protein
VFATTVYAPADGCHTYLPSEVGVTNSDCITCGEAPWRDVHTEVERHVPEIPDEDCLFRMDASDDNGRHWASNGLRWRTQSDAARWTRDLALRWFGCTNLRLVRCADEEVVEVIL